MPASKITVRKLLTKTQLGDNGTIALDIRLLQIRQQVLSLTDHLQQAAAGVMILLMGAQMLGQVADALGQNRNLHLGRTGVALMNGILFDNRIFLFFQHENSTFSKICPRSQKRDGEAPLAKGKPLIRERGSNVLYYTTRAKKSKHTRPRKAPGKRRFFGKISRKIRFFGNPAPAFPTQR